MTPTMMTLWVFSWVGSTPWRDWRVWEQCTDLGFQGQRVMPACFSARNVERAGSVGTEAASVRGQVMDTSQTSLHLGPMLWVRTSLRVTRRVNCHSRSPNRWKTPEGLPQKISNLLTPARTWAYHKNRENVNKHAKARKR